MDFANWFDPLLQGLIIMVWMGPRRNQWGILIMYSIKIGQDQSFFWRYKLTQDSCTTWDRLKHCKNTNYCGAYHSNWCRMSNSHSVIHMQDRTSLPHGSLVVTDKVRNFWIILVLICSDRRLNVFHVLIMLHSVVCCWYHTGPILWCIMLYCYTVLNIRCYMFNDCSMYYLYMWFCFFVRSWVAMVYTIIWCSGRFCSILSYYIVLHVVYCNIAA